MKKLYKRLGFLSLLMFAYLVFFTCFDEYDFFSIRQLIGNEKKIDYFVISDKGDKVTKANPYTSFLYIFNADKTKEYTIILGDSRMTRINPEKIKKYMGSDDEEILNLSYGGAALSESIDEFYFALKHLKIKKVVFELDDHALDINWKYDRTSELLGMDRLEYYKYYLFMYYNNRMAVENFLIKLGILKGKDDRLDYDEQFKNIVDNFRKWQETYQINYENVNRLKEAAKLCDSKGIECVFFCPPVNKVFYEDELIRKNHTEPMDSVKMELSYYGKVLDMHFLSELSYLGKDEWKDPVHYDLSITEQIEKNLAGVDSGYMKILYKGEEQ